MTTGILCGFALSPFVRAVRIVLAEKGIRYDHQPHGFDELKTPAYAAINPFRKMPAWVAADGFTVYETPAILRYLDDVGAGTALTPGTARDRATMTQWIGIAANYLYSVGVTQLVVQRIMMPLMGGSTDEGVVEAAAAITAGHLDVLEGALLGPFIAGEALSQADIMVSVMLDLIDLTPEGASLVAARPATDAYLARLRARDSLRNTFPAMLADRQR